MQQTQTGLPSNSAITTHQGTTTYECDWHIPIAIDRTRSIIKCKLDLFDGGIVLIATVLSHITENFQVPRVTDSGAWTGGGWGQWTTEADIEEVRDVRILFTFCLGVVYCLPQSVKTQSTAFKSVDSYQQASCREISYPWRELKSMSGIVGQLLLGHGWKSADTHRTVQIQSTQLDSTSWLMVNCWRAIARG